jgi:hypothetical protein
MGGVAVGRVVVQHLKSAFRLHLLLPAAARPSVRRRRGATAVEFPKVAVPFPAFFSILQTARRRRPGAPLRTVRPLVRIASHRPVGAGDSGITIHPQRSKLSLHTEYPHVTFGTVNLAANTCVSPQLLCQLKTARRPASQVNALSSVLGYARNGFGSFFGFT